MYLKIKPQLSQHIISHKLHLIEHNPPYFRKSTISSKRRIEKKGFTMIALCSASVYLVLFTMAYLTAPTTSVEAGDDSRLIAFIENWQPCPTAEQMHQYTHVLISFAITYRYSSSKNICNSACNIGSPVPICNNMNNQALIDTWRAQGKKVLVSFGGAGMGGSWEGDNNDCWEYCFEKEQHVVDQLVTIVDTQKFDGVDIDYEYFYENKDPYRFSNGAKARYFVEEVTKRLKNELPSGKNVVTHTPMDTDMVPTSSYYQILKNNAAFLDFLMPQYYK